MLRGQARIDRLLDEAESLRQAMDIRAYVDAVKNIVASETTSISAYAIERWSKWALAEAHRIDPMRSARFLGTFDAKETWGEMWGAQDSIKILLLIQYLTDVIGGRGVLSTCLILLAKRAAPFQKPRF